MGLLVLGLEMPLGQGLKKSQREGKTELPETSCLQNIGGPGGGAVGEGERNRETKTSSTTGLLTNTHARAHMQGPGKRHSAARLSVRSQSLPAAGTGGVQGPQGGRTSFSHMGDVNGAGKYRSQGVLSIETTPPHGEGQCRERSSRRPSAGRRGETGGRNCVTGDTVGPGEL